MVDAAYPRSWGVVVKFGACSVMCVTSPANVCCTICGFAVKYDVTAVMVAMLAAMAERRYQHLSISDRLWLAVVTWT